MPTFRTTLVRGDGTTMGMIVPDEIVEALGQGKRPKVNVTINGYTYRSTVMPYTGANMLPVSAEVREGAGVSAGEEIEVELTLDTAPREVTVPDDLAAALTAEARAAFDGLSFSRRRALVEPIEAAKTPETRQRRIDKAVAELAPGA